MVAQKIALPTPPEKVVRYLQALAREFDKDYEQRSDDADDAVPYTARQAVAYIKQLQKQCNSLSKKLERSETLRRGMK